MLKIDPKRSQNDSQLPLRHQKVPEKLNKNTLAIFNSNDIMPTNADGSMPFRQNNDLFWLSGIDQEESVLVISPNHSDENMREILFLKETSELIAIWEGAKLTKEDAQKTSGIKTIFWLDELENKLAKLISETDAIFLNKNTHSRSTSEVQTRDDRFRLRIAEKFSGKEIKEVAPIMHDLRAIKSEAEIELMQVACNITEKGFRKILPFITGLFLLLPANTSADNYTYVPDDNFEQGLIDLGYDDVLDDYVLTDNIDDVTSLNLQNRGISDATGLEDFTSVTSINFFSNNLTTLDLSGNPALTSLEFGFSNLTTLDLSNNPSLTFLAGAHNDLESIDLSGVPNLGFLGLQNNNLTELDLSNNPGIGELFVNNNNLTSLDLSNQHSLSQMFAEYNNLTRLIFGS